MTPRRVLPGSTPKRPGIALMTYAGPCRRGGHLVGIPRPGRMGIVAKHWRCVIGRHDWRKFETSEGEKGAECSRCGKRDWHHGEPPHMSSKWRMGPQGGGG